MASNGVNGDSRDERLDPFQERQRSMEKKLDLIAAELQRYMEERKTQNRAPPEVPIPQEARIHQQGVQFSLPPEMWPPPELLQEPAIRFPERPSRVQEAQFGYQEVGLWHTERPIHPSEVSFQPQESGPLGVQYPPPPLPRIYHRPLELQFPQQNHQFHQEPPIQPWGVQSQSSLPTRIYYHPQELQIHYQNPQFLEEQQFRYQESNYYHGCVYSDSYYSSINSKQGEYGYSVSSAIGFGKSENPLLFESSGSFNLEPNEESSFGYENEVHEDANVNFVCHDSVCEDLKVDLFSEVIDKNIEIPNNSSLDDEIDERSVEGVCNMDGYLATGMGLEILGVKEVYNSAIDKAGLVLEGGHIVDNDEAGHDGDKNQHPAEIKIEEMCISEDNGEAEYIEPEVQDKEVSDLNVLAEVCMKFQGGNIKMFPSMKSDGTEKERSRTEFQVSNVDFQHLEDSKVDDLICLEVVDPLNGVESKAEVEYNELKRQNKKEGSSKLVSKEISNMSVLSFIKIVAAVGRLEVIKVGKCCLEIDERLCLGCSSRLKEAERIRSQIQTLLGILVHFSYNIVVVGCVQIVESAAQLDYKRYKKKSCARREMDSVSCKLELPGLAKAYNVFQNCLLRKSWEDQNADEDVIHGWPEELSQAAVDIRTRKIEDATWERAEEISRISVQFLRTRTFLGGWNDMSWNWVQLVNQ